MPRMLPRLTEGDKIAYGYQEFYRVALTDLGNGHKEASITTHRTLSDLPEWWGVPDPLKMALTPEENRARAGRRAKVQVRQKCKVMGVNSLFTLTYKANVMDREMVAKHWKAFVTRVRKLLPSFSYVATLEKQKRGAYHIHIATHRLPALLQHQGVKVKSWNLLRAIWRSVVGELGGNFDEAKRKFHAKSRAHKIASYISKYVSKAFDDADEALDGKKRFWVSQGIVVPRPEVLIFPHEQFADLIALVHQACGGQEGHNTLYVDPGRGVFWMCSEAGG